MKFNKIYRVNVGERFYKFTDHKGDHYFGKIENDEPCDWLCEIVEEEKEDEITKALREVGEDFLNMGREEYLDLHNGIVVEEKSFSQNIIDKATTELENMSDEEYEKMYFELNPEDENECKHQMFQLKYKMTGMEFRECLKCGINMGYTEALEEEKVIDKLTLSVPKLGTHVRYKTDHSKKRIVDRIDGSDSRPVGTGGSWYSLADFHAIFEEVCDILNGEKK